MDGVQTKVIGRPIVSDPDILTGQPVVRGTRVPAEIILAYIRGGATDAVILEDYPSITADDIRSVELWACQPQD